MASTALAIFNNTVNGLSITEARKQQVKNIGEALYIAGARETIAHLRKHMIAVRNDVDSTIEKRQRADVIVNIIDTMAMYENSWWIDITELT